MPTDRHHAREPRQRPQGATLPLVAVRLAWLARQPSPVTLEALRDSQPGWYRGTETAYLRLDDDLREAGYVVTRGVAVRS